MEKPFTDGKLIEEERERLWKERQDMEGMLHNILEAAKSRANSAVSPPGDPRRARVGEGE